MRTAKRHVKSKKPQKNTHYAQNNYEYYFKKKFNQKPKFK